MHMLVYFIFQCRFNKYEVLHYQSLVNHEINLLHHSMTVLVAQVYMYHTDTLLRPQLFVFVSGVTDI